MKMLKKLLITLMLVPFLLVADYPQANNEYINDFANVIDDTAEKELYQVLYDIEYSSGVEISVATIESFKAYNTDATWEAFSTGLFNHWGVGNTAENDGVLLLISKDDRKIRIELGAGYPEHYDGVVKMIIDNSIAPLLKAGDYTQGVRIGINEIINITTTPVSTLTWYKSYIPWALLALFSVIVALLIDKDEHPAWYWSLLAVAGIIILIILKFMSSGNRSDGFGGGSSSGGGASGSF